MGVSPDTSHASGTLSPSVPSASLTDMLGETRETLELGDVRSRILRNFRHYGPFPPEDAEGVVRQLTGWDEVKIRGMLQLMVSDGQLAEDPEGRIAVVERS